VINGNGRGVFVHQSESVCTQSKLGDEEHFLELLKTDLKPGRDKTINVTSCGRICLHRKKINLSTVFARSGRRCQGGRRRYLAGQLYGL
jgi:hypothetical protein